MALRRLIVAVLVSCGSMLAVGSSSVDAQQVVEHCYFNSDHDYVCVLTVVGGKSSGGTVGGGESAGSPPLFRWKATLVTSSFHGVGSGRGAVVVGLDECTTSSGAQGLTFVMEMYSIATGALVSTERVCLGEGQNIADFAPPPPPTPDEIVIGQTQLLTLEPQLIPPPAGPNSIGTLVQFESVGWCDYPGPAIIDISLRGWTTHAELKPIKAVWTADGPEPFSHTATGDNACGEPQTVNTAINGGYGAGFHWTPHKSGNYTVTLQVTWSGTAQLTYQGHLAGSYDLGEHTYSESVDQTVNEAQAVASGGG